MQSPADSAYIVAAPGATTADAAPPIDVQLGRPLGVWPLVVGLLLLSGTLAALSFLDSHLALRFAPTANAASGSGAVTQALLRDWPMRLRTAAGVIAVFAALVGTQRRPMARLLRQAIAETPALLRRGWLVATGPDRLALAGLVVIAAVARLPFLSQPIRYDEALTYDEFASRSLAYAVSYYPEPNNQVFHTLLVQAASAVLGSEPWALRVPALVAGLLLVPATYLLGRALFGRWAGLLAAAGVAGCSYLVEFSTLSRGYTLQVLAFALAFALVAHGLREHRAASLLLAALCVWLGFWTIPTMLYGAVVITVWLLLARSGNRAGLGAAALAATTLCALLAFVAYLPVWLVSGPESLLTNRFVAPLPFVEVFQQLPASLARTWQLWQRDLPLPVSLALGALAFVATARSADRGAGRVPLGVLAPAVCLVIAVAQRVVPFERVWLFLLPLFFVLAGQGALDLVGLASRRLPDLRKLASPRPLVTAASLVIAAAMAMSVLRSGSVLASDEVGAYPDAAAATRTLASVLRPGDAVVSLVPASLPELQYAFRHAGLDPAVLVQPATGDHLYVLAPRLSPSGKPLLPADRIDPSRWSIPSPVAAFSTSDLLLLTRSPG